MAAFVSELRYAARSLWKSPAFTAVAVLTLALGIGANTAVFSLLNAVLLRPLPYPDPARLVLVWESAPFFGLDDSPVSPANYADWKQRARSFEEMGALEIAGYRLAGNSGPEMLLGANVTSGLFRSLGTRPLLGRIFQDDDDRRGAPKTAILSESLWRRRFAADPAIVGKTVRLGEETHTVIGVIAAGTEPPSQYVPRLGEIWTPLGTAYSPEQWNDRGRHNWMVIARLKPGVTLAQADAEMRSIGRALAREYPQTNEKVGAFVAPLRDHFVRGSRRILTLLACTVSFVLLIACSNLANLMISRAAARRKEVVVRAALGASTWHITRRFFCESLLLTSLGGLLGLLLATAAFRFLAHFAPGDLTGLNALSLDLRVLAFTSAISVAVAMVFSLIPVLHVRRLDLVDSLKHSARTLAASHSGRTRAVLVASQVALAFMLAVGASLLIQTFLRLRDVDPGFRTRNLLTINLPKVGAPRPTAAGSASWQREILRRIEAVPGVASAGFTNHIPIAFKGDISGVTTEERGTRDRVSSRSRVAGPGYLATMGIPILRGREILESDCDGAPLVVVINQTLARELWPGLDPIGRRLVFQRNVFASVVGVTRDIHQESLDVAPKPEFYISSLQAGFYPSSLAIRTKVDPESVAAAVRQAVFAFDPEQPVTDILTMDQILDQEVSQRRIQGMLLTVFAGLALLLAAIGLYGVLAHSVGLRATEFGVRMALGASPAAVLANVVGQGMMLTLAGLAAGAAAALALSRLLTAFLFGVKPTDPATWAAVAGALLATAALAAYIPARRAMRVDPATALRRD